MQDAKGGGVLRVRARCLGGGGCFAWLTLCCRVLGEGEYSECALGAKGVVFGLGQWAMIQPSFQNIGCMICYPKHNTNLDVPRSLSCVSTKGFRGKTKPINMVIIVHVCVFVQDGRRVEAFRVLSEMKQEGVSPDEKTFRLAIQACG